MTNTEETDRLHIAEIIDRAKQGDDQAFSVLYTTYFSPIYKYIYFKIRNTLDTEDLVQNIFIKAFTSIASYSTYTGSSFLAYMYTIARNITIDYYRKKKIPIADEDEILEIVDVEDIPDVGVRKKDDAELVRLAIEVLPHDQKEVIKLRFMEGLRTEEIACMLGKKNDAVRKLQSRAIKNLQKTLQDTFSL